MSTNISTVYDRLITTIETALPSAKRLPNAYEPTSNSDLLLTEGYGVQIGAGENTKKFISGHLSIARQFTIILTRKVFAKEGDSDNRATAEKQLFEDQLTLIKALEADSTLNGSAVSTDYLSDGGLETVASDMSQFFILQSVFEIEYLESR